MEMDGHNAGGVSGMTMQMTCTASDSPGNLSTIGLEMTGPDIQLDYLAAILNDACLQLWSRAYARYFWYGIVVFVGLFAVKRYAQYLRLAVRQRHATAKHSIKISKTSKVVFDTSRAITYRQWSARAPHMPEVPTQGTLLMLAAYLGFILCLVFIRSSTGDDQSYQSIGVRAAWITVAQLPLVILLASKRNFIGLFTGIGYERLNILHRWVARGLLLTASFHFGFQNEGWRRLGLMHLEWTTDNCPPTGKALF